MNSTALLIATLLPTLLAAAAAQSVSFSTRGTGCATTAQTSERVLVTGAPSTRETYTVTIRGARGATGVLLQAPSGRATPIDLSSRGMPGCEEWVGERATSLPFRFDAAGTAQLAFQIPSVLQFDITLFHQAFVTSYGVNAANMVSSNLAIAQVGNGNLTAADMVRFAPIVRVHPAEEYRPMNPDDFIAQSRFRHHRGWSSDQGFNWNTLSWVTTDSTHPHFYGMPFNVLNSYTLHADGKNRRPRDGNCGDSYNVFLQPDGRPTGPTAPTGVVPAYYHYRRNGERHEIQYWWFSGFNDSVATFNHQGDWEHVTVHVVDRVIVGVYFAAHEGGDFVAAGDGLRFSGTRPVVYMAKGSHASYRTSGLWHYGADSAADGGAQWDTSQMLRPLATQPWKDYAGAWGEVGATGTTTGPLGPWHKRDNP